MAAEVRISIILTVLLLFLYAPESVNGQVYQGGSYGGYGGRLGGYALAGSYSNFVGNCTPMYNNNYGGSYGGGGGSYGGGGGSYGGGGGSYGGGSSYGGSYGSGYGTMATTASPMTNCGFDADAAKVFGYYGYDFPKPPIGLSYPNIGWPYSIPYPYYTPPPYGPVGVPYYGTPVHGYNPYLWGFGSYNGIYGAARGGVYEIKEVPPSYKPSPVYKGYKFGPGGQIIAYYKK